MNNTIKNFLNSTKKGSSTFEYVITLPMTLAIVTLLLFLFLLLTAWINFNALAGDIAKDLNFRQTGQQVAKAWVAHNGGNGGDTIFTASDSFGNDSPVLWNSIKINNQSRSKDKYTQCIGYAMRRHHQKFYMVYANYDNERGTNVNFRTVNAGGTFTDTDVLNGNGRMSNHLVQVNVHWRFLPIRSFYWSWPGIECTSTGYSVIT